MKKLILTFAGMLLVSLMAVNAQVEPSTEMNQDTTSAQTPGVIGEDQSNFSRDMEVVQPTDLPETLRSALEGPEYSGWEAGRVYRNTTTNEYLIVVGEQDPKVYRFDSEGNRLEDLNAQPGNDMNQTPDAQPSPDAQPEQSTPTPDGSTPADPDQR